MRIQSLLNLWNFFLYSTHWLDAIDTDLEESVKKLQRTIGLILGEIDSRKTEKKEDIIVELIENGSINLYEFSRKIYIKKNRWKFALFGLLLIITLIISYNMMQTKDYTYVYNLGEDYFYQEDYERAVHNYKKAAEGGNEEAKLRLGMAYYYGLGVEEDKVTAIRWYKRAAEGENLEAKYRLAEIYQEGSIVPRDYEESLRLYRKVASYGNPNAQYKLATFYEGGLAIDQDYQKAAELYRLAASQGHKVLNTH